MRQDLSADGQGLAGKALEMTGNLKSEGLSIKGSLKELELEGTVDLTDSGVRYADLLNKPRGTALRIGRTPA